MEQDGYIEVGVNLDSVFAALADPTRREILSRLAGGQATVGELAEPFEMSQPAISKHLKVLERAGLVERFIDQQRRPARLKADNLAMAEEWLRDFKSFWVTSFNQIDDLLVSITENDERENQNE